MKNQIVFLALILALSLLVMNPVPASACTTIDWEFNLNVGDLNLDKERLGELCAPQTCTIEGDNFIAIRSRYNTAVALIIGRTANTIGFEGITIRLPYVYDDDDIPAPAGIVPGAYGWKESVKTDFAFLKEIGILDIPDSDIEAISGLAANGKNIIYHNGWRQLNSNCVLDEETGEELCTKCICVACGDKIGAVAAALPAWGLGEEMLVPLYQITAALIAIVIILLVVAKRGWLAQKLKRGSITTFK